MKNVKWYLLVIGCILAGLPSQAWAQNLTFGQTETGTIASAAQTNSYTFSANANDVVDFTMTASSGTLVPKLQLYNPTGTLISSANSGGTLGCSGSTLAARGESRQFSFVT